VAIVFTSGTTGTPKGAVFCVRQLRALAEAEIGDAWGGGGASYNSTPFPHVGFMGRFPWQLRLGGTVHLMARFRAEDALRLVEELALRSIGGIGAQVALMMRHPDFERRDVSSVESIVLGGGPVDAALRREIMERFDARLSIRFSCTESGGIGCGTALDSPEDEALETVGRPRGPVVLSIRDDGGREVPAGEVGEVCFLTPTAMSGYWQDPEATAAAFWPGGALRTGDLGWVDDAGCLRLAGRLKEMYVRGGYNVYPAEVEAVLRSHPAVEDVAVVGRTDPVMGEVGVAVVVPAPGAAAAPSLEELRAFGASHLAAYKLPEDLRVVDALPLTALDKVDRRALEDTVQAR
jgi:acyl-CoA synthetase (AMP-forming)/AMP-acid ligase II